ncbi:hypothetical protein AMTRI_Chr12g234930 [Amborella trichopoda]
MDGLTKYLQDEVPWYMLFTDDIVLIDETQNDVNTKLEFWRDALEFKYFKISGTKIDYMECKFSNNRSRDEEVVKIDSQQVQKRPYFRYLGSLIHENEEIEEDVAHKIRIRWANNKKTRDRIHNESIQENLGVAPIGHKMRECGLRWAGRVWCRPSTTPVRKCKLVQVEGLKMTRGRLKRTWLEVVRKDTGTYDLTEDMTFNRAEWRTMIYVAPPIN